MKKIISLVLVFFRLFIISGCFAQYHYTAPDLSILERSLRNRENKRNAANENLYTLKTVLGNLKSELNGDVNMQRWISIYSDSIVNIVQDEIESGNYGMARDIAAGFINSVSSDPKILRMKQINEEYKEFKEFVRSKYIKGEITLTAFECWVENNPSLNANTSKYQYDSHWYPTYRIANSLNLDDMCEYINNKTSDESEYYKYACEYASMKNGSIEQEYKEIEYKLKVASLRHLMTEVEKYNRILPYKRNDLNHFIVRLFNELNKTNLK